MLSFAKPMSTEAVALSDSLGRVLANDTLAPSDMPRFDNSAVDGYAVSEADLNQVGVKLKLVGRIRAGGTTSGLSVSQGESVQVMTGAPVPVGTAAVTMQEDVELDGGSVVLLAAAKAGKHVRPRGHEFRKGDRILDAGAVVTPPVLGGLAALGVSALVVRKRPSVGILVTGDELLEVGANLHEGQIYESNSFAIGAVLTRLGVTSEVMRAKDSADETVKALQDLASRCDVLVTSGGVSVGDFDFVRGALCTLGFETIVPKVAVKPGKPFVFAVRHEDSKFACGLPGNPMSSLVTFSLFVWPLLFVQCGLPEPTPLEAQLTTNIESGSDRVEFVPGQCEAKDGRLFVSPEPTVGSHAVAGLAGSDCLIECPIGVEMKADSIVRTWPLPWRQLL